MKKPQFIKTLLLTSLCLLPVSTVEASEQWRQAFVEGDHTFTITFSANIEAHKDLLQSVQIFVDGTPETIAHTATIDDAVMTLDPKSDLQPSETYTVEVLLTNGEKFERNFFIRTIPAPIRTFIEQYPDYDHAAMITTMLDQFDDVSYSTAQGEQPNTALQQAVQAIPSNVDAFKKIITQIESLYNNAAKDAASASANETEVEMQLEALHEMSNTHILNASSINTLTQTHQTRENAVRLLQATPKATEEGLELVSALEELNNVISDILLVAPASQTQLHYVNTLQTSFTQNIAHIAASDSTIAKQITAIETLLDNSLDYIYLLDEISEFVAEVEFYQVQFASWKDVSNVSAAYKKLQNALSNVNNKLASTSNITSIEATLETEKETMETMVSDITTYIDTYLEKEIEYLNAALENVETAADAKELDYMTLEAYLDADEAILNIESTYSFYDETIQYNTFKADLKAAHDKIAALKRELGV